MKVFVVLVVLSAIVGFSQAGPGALNVYNSGGYVAVFTVDYDLNGKHQSVETGDFTLGVTKTIPLPDGAKNILLKVECYWFLGLRSTIFTRTFDRPINKCFKVWGTTLNPSWDEINC